MKQLTYSALITAMGLSLAAAYNGTGPIERVRPSGDEPNAPHGYTGPRVEHVETKGRSKGTRRSRRKS